MSQPTESIQGPMLRVDFTWRKFKSYVTEVDPETGEQRPYMIVDCNMTKLLTFAGFRPHLEFKSAVNDSKIDDIPVGTGSLHTFKIDADYVLRGREGQIKALKRWKTSYSHLSQNYGSELKPMTMTWTTSSNFVDWDFICMDENMEPVARFSSSWWAVRKLGNIEFVGDKANDPAAREEIVVTGLTLFYCMVMRMNSLFSFFGAIFAKPGPIEPADKGDDPPQQIQMKDMGSKGKAD